jgi:hypothetical protein
MNTPQITLIVLLSIVIIAKVIRLLVDSSKKKNDEAIGTYFIAGFFFLVLRYSVLIGILIWGGFFK